MPSKSKSQKRLFCMAKAVRDGKLSRSDVHKEVLDIVDSDMTDKQINDFCKESEGLRGMIEEAETNDICTLEPYDDFIMVKPGALKHTDAVLTKLGQTGYKVVKVASQIMSVACARDIYRDLKDEKWFNDMCAYLSSGYSIGMLVKKKPEWPKPDKTCCDEVGSIKHTIRKQYAKDKMKNVMHSSENYSAAQREAFCYFNKY